MSTTMDGTLLPFLNTTACTFPDHTAAEYDFEHPSNAHQTIGSLRHIAPLPLWSVEKPFCLTLPLPVGQPKSNVVVNTHVVPIRSARGREEEFKLDSHGFQFIELPKLQTDIEVKSEVEGEGGYIEQMEEWLKQELGAQRVCVFDYTIRKRKPKGEKYTWKDPRPPAINAHIDQTAEAALARLRLHFSDEVDELLRGRVQLINLWRPTFGPVLDFPMAVCDARTIDSADLIAQDLVYPHYVGENYQLKYNQSQRWYYLDRMTTNEGILIKNFDSKLDGRARLCPHSSFCDHNTPPDAQLRQSIEIRAMVFHTEK